MLNTLHEWCIKWRLLINQEKTKIIHFRPVAVQITQFDFKCGEVALEKESTYEPRHAIMCLREINYVMRYDVVKSDVIISRRA